MKETQKVTQKWIWILLLSCYCIVTYRFVENNEQYAFIRSIVILSAVCILFFIIRLETIIQKDGLYIRFFPVIKRFIPKENIKSIELIKYSPIVDFLGWGIRTNKKGEIIYSISGNKALKVTLTNNRIVYIGTNLETINEGIILL